MNEPNFQTLYYQLAVKELRYLQELLELSEGDKAQVTEYLDHNELGLAFEVLKDSGMNLVSDAAAAQIEILGSFLQN